MKTLIIVLCEALSLICIALSFLIAVIVTVATFNQDPRLADPDYKRIFLAIICPLIVALTCAGIRSLYNEKAI